jgi:hypothetical protein
VKRGTSIFNVFLVAAALCFYGCGDNKPLPVENFQKTLKDVSDYSIILEDMKEEGNFFKNYFHKYRIVQPDKVDTTEWLKVPENFYRANEQFLGMVIAGKKDWQPVTNVAPAGYHYVGDSRYGTWRDDGRGGSFWEFYGKYRLLSDFMGMWYQPVYSYEFDAYRKFKNANAPYFGDNKYGTTGSFVKQHKPDFYQRYMAKQQSVKSSFSDKVSQRIGRSRTSFRGRSGSGGK